MINWSTNSDEIYNSIISRPSKVKFILKTKNEFELLERWITHHINIAGNNGIIIFDNLSNNPIVQNLYNKYKDIIQIFKWDANHNLIHNVDYCKKLYDAIKASSDYYCFLDTDEYAYWIDGNNLISDKRFLVFLDDVNFSINYPGLWMINYPGVDNIFRLNDSCTNIHALLEGGKPLINSSVNVSKFINHNSQLLANNKNLKIRGGFIVTHLKNIDSTRRIRLNIDKCIAHGFAKNLDDIEEIILKKDFTNLDKSYVNYITEIIQFRNSNIFIPNGPAEGQLLLQDNGAISFNSPDVVNILSRFMNQLSVTNGKISC